jgi:hypothetical protein
MTDDELLELELAAKAAKLLIRRYKNTACLQRYRSPESVGYGRWVLWNPLTDDGDAFRLAGRLELDVMHRVVGGKRVEVLAAGGPLIQEFYEGEPYAAARRAIVRAAAEVARKRATKETA